MFPDIDYKDQYGIPGRVVPGVPRVVSGHKATDYNDLVQASLRKPEIIPGLFKHFSEETGMMSYLLQYTNQSFNPVLEAQKKIKSHANGGMYADNPISKQMKYIGDHQFQWAIDSPNRALYKIKRLITTPVNNVVGVGGAPFQIAVGTELTVSKDDIFSTGDGPGGVLLKVVANPRDVSGERILKVKKLIKRGGSQEAVPAYLVQARAELERVGNQKTEWSSHGSKTDTFFGEWARGWMTTMRWEWNISGHAAHTEIPKENLKWLVYTDNDGKKHRYWMDVKRYEMMKEAYWQMDWNCFWGQADVNADGSFAMDGQGNQYISGDGIYHQCNQRLRREYNELTLNDFEQQAQDMYYDTHDKKPTLVYFGGIKFITAFSRLIYQNFSNSPEVLYFDGVGNYQAGSSKGDKMMRGIRTNFNYYETDFAKIIVAPCHYFDRKVQATLRLPNGDREQSYRAIVLNISKNMKGESPISLLTMAGRKNVIGRLFGMANPGPGGVISTPVDMQGEHMLCEMGVAAHNPNIMGELSRAKQRV